LTQDPSGIFNTSYLRRGLVGDPLYSRSFFSFPPGVFGSYVPSKVCWIHFPAHPPSTPTPLLQGNLNISKLIVLHPWTLFPTTLSPPENRIAFPCPPHPNTTGITSNGGQRFHFFVSIIPLNQDPQKLKRQEPPSGAVHPAENSIPLEEEIL